jgi:hypothetical protein
MLQGLTPSAGQYDLDGSSLQLGQASNGHRVLDNTTVDQDGCAAPCSQSICSVADIIGKPEGLTRV